MRRLYSKTRAHRIDSAARRLDERARATAAVPPDRPLPEPDPPEVIRLLAGNGRVHEVEVGSAVHRHLVENHAAVEIDAGEAGA